MVKRVSTGIKIDENLRNRAKMNAIKQGIHFYEFIEDAIREKLDKKR